MSSLALPLGAQIFASPLSDEQVRGIIISLFPPGNLYDFENVDSDIYKFMASLGASWNNFGFGVINTLRTEFNPATCIQKIPDWEASLNLDPLGRTTTQRQNAIVAKLREFGAPTVSNIQNAIAPLLGYTNASDLVVYEYTNGNHFYGETSVSAAIPASSFVERTVVVKDTNVICNAGIYLKVTITFPTCLDLTFKITGPDGTNKSFTLSNLANVNVTNGLFIFFGSEFAGKEITGTWTFRITNAAGNTGTLVTWLAALEGIGPFLSGYMTGGGLGEDFFDWGVYADPALVNSPDYNAALLAIGRWQPAGTIGYLIRNIATKPDDPTAIPDQCLPG